jgi:predicted outer membrane repeat protein
MFNDGDGGAGNFLGFNGMSSPRIIHSTFAGNKAASGGAIYNAGRDGGVSSPEIVNTAFTGNTASDRGGAILSDGDAGSSSPQVTNVTFTDNTAASGGAMYNDGRNGGTSSPEVANTAFAGNTVSDQGGAIFNNAEMGASSPQIANATFTNNVASSGGAVYNHGAGGSNRPEIANTILWSNTASSSGDEIYNYSAEPTLTHTLIQGGLGDIVNDAGSSTTDGGGNLTQDPLFADASNPDGPDDTPATADDGLRLTGGSPALDAGNNNEIPLDATDLDGDNTTFEPIPFDITGTNRIRDNDGDAATSPAVDVGAYEAPADVVLPVELASLEGTHTGDGVQLSWTTTSETNNAGFQVQRQRLQGSPGEWREVGFVESAGTTSEPQTYRFTDADLPYAADSLRYRLKQVDVGGTATLTDPITIARGGPAGLELLGTAPNPASRRATVRYAVPEGAGGDVTLRLYDVLGRTVRMVTARAEAGRHTRTLDVSGLASGTYFLRLQAGGPAVTRKITVTQ